MNNISWFSENVLCSTQVRNCPFSGNPLRGRYQRGCFRSLPPSWTSWDLQVRLSLYHLCFTSSVFLGTLLYLIIPIIFTHNPNPGVSCTWQTGCLPCWALRGLNHHLVRFPFQFPSFSSWSSFFFFFFLAFFFSLKMIFPG